MWGTSSRLVAPDLETLHHVQLLAWPFCAASSSCCLRLPELSCTMKSRVKLSMSMPSRLPAGGPHGSNEEAHAHRFEVGSRTPRFLEHHLLHLASTSGFSGRQSCCRHVSSIATGASPSGCTALACISGRMQPSESELPGCEMRSSLQIDLGLGCACSREGTKPWYGQVP